MNQQQSSNQPSGSTVRSMHKQQQQYLRQQPQTQSNSPTRQLTGQSSLSHFPQTRQKAAALAKQAYHSGNNTVKHSISKDQVMKLAAHHNLPDVDLRLSHKLHQNLTCAKSTSRLETTGASNTNKLQQSKSQKGIKPHGKRAHQTPLGYASGTPLLNNQSVSAAMASITPNNHSSNQGHRKSMKQLQAQTSMGALLQQSSIKQTRMGHAIESINASQPSILDNSNTKSNHRAPINPIMKRIVKKANLQAQLKHQQSASGSQRMTSPKQYVTPVLQKSQRIDHQKQGSQSIQSLQGHHQKQNQLAATDNLSIRISQILRNSQKSPSDNDRDVVKFYDQLDQLFEMQKLRASEANPKQARIDSQTGLRNINEVLFPQQLEPQNRLSQVVVKTVNTQKNQTSTTSRAKSRESKKSFQQQTLVSRSNKSQATKDEINKRSTKQLQQQSILASQASQVEKKDQKHGEAINKAESRNNQEQESGSIDLRILAQNKDSLFQGRHSQKVIRKANDVIIPVASHINPGGLSVRESPNVKELQFNRQLQSKSQCKERNALVPGSNANNLMKKSFSIALLKANGSNGGLRKLTNEYNTLKSREEQKSPFGMNYYMHNNSQREYAGSAQGHAIVSKRSDSLNSISSIGDVSVNSVKQQAIKNNSHYGALKHLANSGGKTGALFTRNNSQSQKKLSTLDENVCVNQIRETGLVSQKFSNKESSSQVQNRFSARKNYGSVCIQPGSVKNKPLFFSVADGKVITEQSSSHQGEARLSSVEDQSRHYDIFQQNQIKRGLGASNLRMAVSQASSPVMTPKGQHCPTQSTQLKSPFLTKESRKHLGLKDKVPRPKKNKINSNQLSADMKQSKLWAEHTGSESKRARKSSGLAASMKSNRGFQSGIQTNQRSTKQNTIEPRNSSNHGLPVNSQAAQAHQQNSQNSTTEFGQKIKRHKFSKSREFYGSGVINQMNLNSSITSRASQLKQDNVLMAKRKSHGLTIQSGDIAAAALKRRSSGSNILIASEHNQTQPLNQKKMRKITSISPPKHPSQLPGEESKSSDKKQFVEKIVDLLEKRNLIDTKSNLNNKPKVNQILSSLLKAHLKNVDGSSAAMKQQTGEETKVADTLSSPQSKAKQPLEYQNEPESKQIQVKAKQNSIGDKHSESSTIYLGTAPEGQNFGSSQSGTNDKRAATNSNSPVYVATKKPRNPNRCKRTPATKFPVSSSSKSNSATKQEQASLSNDYQQQLPTNQGEMTSPDELYYVNTKGGPAAMAPPSGTTTPNLARPTQHRIYSSNSRSPQSDAQPYPRTNSQEQSSIESQGAGIQITSGAQNAKLQSQGMHQQSRQSASSSQEHNQNVQHSQHSHQSNQYYKSIGKPSASSLDDRRSEGQSAYYVNRATKQQINAQELQKESTRFSSNERSQQPKETQRNHSGGSHNPSQSLNQKTSKMSTKEYNTPEQVRQSISNQHSSSLRHTGQTSMMRRTDSQGRRADSQSSIHEEKSSSNCLSSLMLDSQNDQNGISDQMQAARSDSEDDSGESLIVSIRRHYMNLKSRMSHFTSTLRCYNVEQIVGKGAFGKVALATQRLTGKSVAIKMIDKSNLQAGQMDKLRCEVALMSAIRHKHIIRLLEVFESKQHMYMVFEYASGGDLLQLVKRKRALTEKQARSIFRQVVYGIAHCHCRSVLHRDIKLDNILLDEHGNVKVCDFGISRTLEDPSQPVMEQCGTPAYIAPEILYEDGYKGFKSDIWGLGVLLYAMVTGTVPFRAQNMRELKYVISSGQFSFPKENPRDGSRLSDLLQDLVRSMLIVDTKRRISIPEILAHPWLSPLQDRQSMQQGLNYQQLLSIHALQPFGADGSEVADHQDGTSSRVNQIRVENLFIGHGSDSDENDSSLNARIEALTLTQPELNEITIDHATVYINEKAISKCEQFGFPKKMVRQQVQSNVLNHATACYHLLVF